MVVVRKQTHPNGFSYEVENHDDYLHELEKAGIPSPKARYRIITPRDIDEQVIVFFRLTGIKHEIKASVPGESVLGRIH